MQNLEEGIITNSAQGLGFCNKQGLKILKQIKKHKLNPKTEKRKVDKNLDRSQSSGTHDDFYNELDWASLNSKTGLKKTPKQEKAENEVLKKQVFKFHII